MKWSIKVGKVAGIDLYLHITFLILIAWLLGSHYLIGHSLAAALSGVSFTLLVFVIIVLHELGHALAARRYGIKTRNITLLPIGGVAQLERMPKDPRQELVVALAGPTVNIVLAGILLAIVSLSAGFGAITNFSFEPGNFLVRLFWINLWLAGFNLLPAFPMDGGRVLRALLTLQMNRSKATDIAARVGQFMAIIFGFVGLFTHPFLLFIALFVWMGAEGEANQVRMEHVLSGVRVKEVMAREFEVFEPNMTITQAAQRLVPGFQTQFPVVQAGQVLGLIGLEELIRGVTEGGPDRPIEEFLDRAVVTTSPDELLIDAMQRWQDAGTKVMVVLDIDRLVGLMTAANIGEYFLIQDALSASIKQPVGAKY